MRIYMKQILEQFQLICLLKINYSLIILEKIDQLVVKVILQIL